MFYSGSLQEGIAQAVSQAKAVVCFVRDDSDISSTWENEHFTDSEFAQLLESRSVLLRLTKDSAEAGFLTSFCPVTKFPTVIVIKDGTLREYIVPDIEKEGFQARLRAAIGDAAQPQTSAQPTGQSSSAATTGTTAPVPASESVSASSSAPVAASTPISPTPGPAAPRAQPVQSQQQPQQKREEAPAERKPEKLEQPQTPSAKSIKKPATQKKDPAPAPKISINKQDKPAQSSRGMKVEMPTSPPSKSDQEPAPKPQPTPPRQYRLQVRLFDGSSVRSSFTPTQTIRGDVRPWVDNQLEEKRPYNLKHILTPLPNRTLTIAEEEQTLEELGLGSTANLVMVPINTYTEAYSTSGASLPVRAVSSAYGIVSSVVGTATGLVGSLFGYTQPAPAAQTAPSAGSQAENTNTAGAARPRPTGSGLNIRTLHDRRESRDDSQLYNGNQLNFQPRRDEDGRSLQ